jgi:hypothetical protein
VPETDRVTAGAKGNGEEVHGSAKPSISTPLGSIADTVGMEATRMLARACQARYLPAP